MSTITAEHFGANMVLTLDSLRAGSGFRTAAEQLNFSHYRYPGGSVTEEQTWANGGLDRMFGPPTDPSSPDHLLTLGEALAFSRDSGTAISIVVPTFQFFDKAAGTFDAAGFGRYVAALEAAIVAVPGATIEALQIGNEFWDHRGSGALTPTQYGAIANHEIPALHAMTQRLAATLPDWDAPDIGIQAGAHWRWTGPTESLQIGTAISVENRALVDVVYQHSYPDLTKDGLDWQRERAIDPMHAFASIGGFRSDLTLTLSEFNVLGDRGTGVDRAAAWIEELAAHIDAGIDRIDHWGIAYDWLTSKLYDTAFPRSESMDGDVAAVATPMGMTFDLARTHAVGKDTMTDGQALAQLAVSHEFAVTGMRDADQRVLFLHNDTGARGWIDLASLDHRYHVATHLMAPADSPATGWADESAAGARDARADMRVIADVGMTGTVGLNAGDMVVLVVTRAGKAVFLEGAHHVTDPGSGMGDDVLTGGDGHDVLLGHAGDDQLNGGAGRNLLVGGRGDDLMRSVGAGDVMLAGLGADTVLGGMGEDVVLVGPAPAGETTQVSTADGRDVILASVGARVEILDFADDDRLGFGGAFADMAALAAAIRDDAGDLVIDLPDGGEVRLIGQAERAATLFASVLDFRPPGEVAEWQRGLFAGLTRTQIDTLYDHVADSVAAGRWGPWLAEAEALALAGNLSDRRDAFAAGSDQDWTLFAVRSLTQGNDVFRGAAAASHILGLNGRDHITGGAAADVIEGGDGNDILHGMGGADTLFGGAGDDLLSGLFGDDSFHGGDGADTLYGGNDADRLSGDAGNDWVDGGTGDDTLAGGSGNDRLLGRDGIDRLRGGDGRDVLIGGNHADQLFGDGGNDYLRGGHGNDRLYGNTDDDRLLGDAGDDHLDGGVGNDTLFGGTGSDRLIGWGGQDHLDGGTGNDRIEGGHGRDVMVGGSGADVFVFTSVRESHGGSATRDIIRDFRPRIDHLDLRAIDADTGRGGDQRLDYAGTRADAHAVWWQKIGGDVVVMADVDGDARADLAVLLTGCAGVSAGDFLL